MRIFAVIVLLAGAVPAHSEWRTTVANAATPHHVAESFRIAPGSLIRVGYTGSFEDMAQPLWIDAAAARVTLRVPGEAARTLAALSADDSFSVIVQVPAGFPLGPAEISLNDLPPVRGELVRHSFRVFTINSGSGPARADNGLAKPAGPGSIVTLWGTGQNGGTVAGSVGGKPVEVLYAGPAPSLPGVDQLNLRLPSEVPAGCYTGLSLSAAGEDVNPVTITTGTAPCTHPLGFTPEQLARLDRGDRVNMAAIRVNSAVGPTPSDPPQWETFSRMEDASASITAIDSAMAWMFYQPSRIQLGTCALFDGPVIAGLIFGGAAPGGDGERMPTLGSSIRLEGPNRSFDLRPVEPENRGYYGLPLHSAKPDAPTVWTPGKWTIRGEGDSHLEPFATDVLFSPPLEITNVDQLRSIDRAADLTIRWNPGAVNALDVVTISINGYRSQVTCSARVDAGSIVVPRNVLAGLQPMPADSPYPAVLHIGQNRPADQPLLLPLKTSMPVTFSESSAFFMKVNLR